MTGGSKTYIPKNFYRTGESKMYIPKNFYTKTTYITLLSEKFGGSGAPPRPYYTSPLNHIKIISKNSYKGVHKNSCTLFEFEKLCPSVIFSYYKFF
ncbi:hypothetical protein Hanom_Chr12g01076401 [Helianthus anomalus]